MSKYVIVVTFYTAVDVIKGTRHKELPASGRTRLQSFYDRPSTALNIQTKPSHNPTNAEDYIGRNLSNSQNKKHVPSQTQAVRIEN